MKIRNKTSIRGLSAICCVICMLFLLFAGTQNVYAQNLAEIVAVSSTAEKGGTAKVALNLSNNPGIWGMKFKVGYDHEAMSLKSVDVGNVFTKGEITSPESLDQEKYLFYATANEIKNISSNGTLVVLEFQIKDTAASKDYTVSLELTQCINVDGDDVTVKMVNGKITVVDCLHSGKEWKVTESPKCEQKGTETESCKKCGQVFGTREVKETGHQNTEVKNVVKATEEKEGYTGDTYCKDCGKMLKKGEVVAKVEKPVQQPTPQPTPQPSESESTSEVETESETEKQTEIESEVESEIESESQSEENMTTGADKQNNSPLSVVLVVILIIVLLGALAFMYIKFIKRGR